MSILRERQSKGISAQKRRRPSREGEAFGSYVLNVFQDIRAGEEDASPSSQEHELPCILCILCTQERAADDWIVPAVVKDIENLGHRDIVLKCDGENAIREPKEKIRRKRADGTLMENPPKGDSQANGFIEGATGIVKAQVRAMKDALDTRLGEKIPPDSPILTWLVRYAAVVWNRYEVTSDGKTAYERIRGKQCTRPISEFGDCIHDKPLK